MKRNLAFTSTRSTAGCLPVPLFNQKKRSRQPLTSNPLKNDPSPSTTPENYDFPPLPSDFAWEEMKHQGPQLKQGMNSGFKEDDRNISTNSWNRYEFNPLGRATDLMAASSIVPGQTKHLEVKPYQKQLEYLKLSQQKETALPRQMYSSKTQWSEFSTKIRQLENTSSVQAFKYNSQLSQYNKKAFGDISEEKTMKTVPTVQLKLKEKDNSLRIISAVIESVKYWSGYTYKTVLLFEVLGTLDSAVTPGDYGAKTFLLRDGRNTLPCIFYEIDRELPRLIRGKVHRCVGNYDKKRNIFKCVSVRPASVPEQKAFQEFVKISDSEMRRCIRTVNEV
ncbi:spermatogenesis-associated protein 22 isoform X1 [Tachyglossus aculeatus]|uniref:spermatogenesis-associated protein 22 isoform X1 n=2 Tax=Tachyglossus aculeatus TaxID=9261 RepID=UPI0018F508E1|nr:spermatogenesis-associated protein 22 isoform X1 [Tachyglossus aculeatus]XP_038615567.1 spermatogenesis-associated protein 22 isoform X1 [Tachyglossus aculeatus]